MFLGLVQEEANDAETNAVLVGREEASRSIFSSLIAESDSVRAIELVTKYDNSLETS